MAQFSVVNWFFVFFFSLIFLASSFSLVWWYHPWKY